MSGTVKSVDEHLAGILEAVPLLAPLEVALLDAEGTALAEVVTAPVSLPPFDNSAMDGYAVCASDVATASPETPVTLPVIGDVAAGDESLSAIRPGLSARIMTGAPMPAGADAVIPVEWTDGGVVNVTITRSAPEGHYIRRAGEDVTAGQLVMEPGVRLGAAQLGMLAAVGRPAVTVRPKPRVVVMSTGSELREPGTQLAPGQIWDSNSFMLATAVREAGGVGYRHPMVADEPETVLETIKDQLIRADAIVTSGGVSMGAKDVIKEVLSGVGTMEFAKVAMRPGRPQGFGLIDGNTPIFTLPGNPVSAYVSFQVFVRPALRAMQGLPPESLPTVAAVLTQDVTSPRGLRHFLRATLTRRGDAGATGGHGQGRGRGEQEPRWTVSPAEGQGSHQLAALASATGLIAVPEDVETLPAGSTVAVMRLP